MALRKVMNYIDDDVLRKKCRRVEKVDNRILVLLEDMAETMYASSGVGLAAPQVGILKRIVVIDVGEGLLKLINPEIISAQEEQQGVEGCLSVPGIVGEVKRPNRVKIKALNEKGEAIEIEGTDILARAFCHEIDHLDGVLFIDKIVEGTKKMI